MSEPYPVRVLLESTGFPAEWPRDLPSCEAAFVFAMRLRAGEADYHRGERRQLARTAAACRRAVAEINRCPTAFLAFPFPEGSGQPDRRFGVLEDLQLLADYCEQASRGRPGRPRDDALRHLIRAKYRDFRRDNPHRKGYWRTSGGGEWRGRFLEQMEETLQRLGYPAQSREALGSAVEQALTTTA